MSDNRTTNKDEVIELNYFAEIQPFRIKYTLNEESVSFFWKRSNTSSSSSSSYKPLGTLRTRIGKTSNQIDIFSSSDKTPLFIFHIISRSPSNETSRPIDHNLFNSLFPTAESSVVLIASNDGYLYWSPILNDNKTVVNLLSNTLDTIIYIDSFSCGEENRFGAVSSTRRPLDDNCLYVVSKSGKLFVYSYLKSGYLSYKICILPHFIHSCVAYFDNERSTHYLVYSTSSSELYIVRLSDSLKGSSVMSKLIRKFNSSIQLGKGQNNQIVVKTSIGSEIIDLKSLTITVESGTEKLIDKQTIKENLEKLCKKSNEIVKYQQKLDKLNFVLKQINQIETIHANSEKNRYFEVHKRLKLKQSKQISIEVELKNKSMQIENNDASYYLFVCVKFEKHSSYYWAYRCERLGSLKVESKHLVRIDATESILNRLFHPTRLRVYLVYDVVAFLGDHLFQQPTLNEFSVCLHESEFELDDFFGSEIKLDNMCLEPSCELLWHVISGFRSKFRPNLDRLDDIWTSLSIDGISSEHLKNHSLQQQNDVKATKISKTSSINPNLHLTKTIDDNEMKISINFTNSTIDNMHWFRRSLSNMIHLKNKYLKDILKVNHHIRLNESQKAELGNLFETFNELLATNNKRMEVEKSLVEESFQIDQATNKDEMHSQKDNMDIETAFLLLKIYLTLRKIIYSNLKLN